MSPRHRRARPSKPRDTGTAGAAYPGFPSNRFRGESARQGPAIANMPSRVRTDADLLQLNETVMLRWLHHRSRPRRSDRARPVRARRICPVATRKRSPIPANSSLAASADPLPTRRFAIVSGIRGLHGPGEGPSA